MKILITGGAGYVGSTLTDQLLARGDSVRCFDTLQFGAGPIMGYFRNPNFELVRGDIRDCTAVAQALKGVDAVIHLASLVGYPACKMQPRQAREVNVGGTSHLLSQRAPGQAILMASTGSVYGAVPEGFCDEQTPVGPLSLYAETKAEAEQMLMHGADTMAYRFATAFGLSPRLRLDLLVNDLCYQAVNARNVVLYESHFQRTFIHVHDMGRAFLHALDHFDVMRGQIFNCGDTTMNASKLDIANLIQDSQEYYLHLADAGHDLDARDYEMSYARIQDTGYRTSISLKQGIDEMVRAFQYLNVAGSYRNAEVYA